MRALRTSTCSGAQTGASGAAQAVVRDRMAELDGKPASALTVSGELAVGGLYQVLDSCGARLYEESCDVPVLLAPLPFAAASLQALQPEVFPPSPPSFSSVRHVPSLSYVAGRRQDAMFTGSGASTGFEN